jgi:predicted transcriptional regulator of viral defense system
MGAFLPAKRVAHILEKQIAEMYDRGTESSNLLYKSAMNMRAFLAQRQVFSLEDFTKAFPELSSEAAKKQLQRAASRGEVKSVGRALYAVVPGDQLPSLHRTDPFLLLNARVDDAVFCGHSALELNGLAYSVWNVVTAYTSGNRQSFQREGTRYRLLATPKPLTRYIAEPSLKKVDRHGTFLMVLSIERTLVEGFRSPKEFGGLSEFLDSVGHIDRVKESALLSVLEAFGEKKLYACVGWFLEREQPRLSVSPNFLEVCRHHQPTKPVYLTRNMGAVRKASGWNLLIPEKLNHQEDRGAPEF